MSRSFLAGASLIMLIIGVAAFTSGTVAALYDCDDILCVGFWVQAAADFGIACYFRLLAQEKKEKD